MFSETYKGRRVLVTGHTGFKGSWLCSWLLELGAEVAGYSLYLPSDPCHFSTIKLGEKIYHIEDDVRNKEALKEAFDIFKPEIVFHLAAQPLVRKSYKAPAETFETNVMGTLNVLECVRECPSMKAAVFITSDKCYENVEWLWGYRENDRLGGADPYSASKACAELILSSYMRSFFQEDGAFIATARAGNVIGGGDWAPDRIIPDCVRAWSHGNEASIRHPDATRPWQHVLEPIDGYLRLAQRLFQEDDAVRNQSFNFGPGASTNQTVGELIEELAGFWDNATWSTVVSEHGKKEAGLLKLNCDKALSLLDWSATLNFKETMSFTGEWYQAYYSKGAEAASALTVKQIKEFSARAKRDGSPWTQ
ncbi:MAG: CDP-glucose 4,6-dehydratase [Nitrospinae bacterium CG11_big_fil_rev_8_21_14_0_20_45_15]|nr:MAG: CDP-glucose 4,6-dehydratase [Nitrospinae bacterium CG11_big_fil_rev_8_21_14_0_20_45_15]